MNKGRLTVLDGKVEPIDKGELMQQKNTNTIICADNSADSADKSLDILAIGEAVIDFTPAGKTENGNTLYERQPGGAPANVLTQATLLGSKTALNGLVGCEPFGDFLAQVLAAKGISTKGLIRSNQYPTHTAMLDIDEHGERSFFSVQNESALYTYSIRDIRYDLIDRCRILHISGAYMSRPEPLKAMQHAVEYARKQNKLISCDINWRPCLYDKEYAQEKILPVLCHMDILKFSQEEIELLTDAQDIKEGCEKLAEKGVRLVVVTRGARGCYYYYAGGRGWIPTYAVKVVDTNAAGDAFMGAMISQLAGCKTKIEKIPEEKMRDILEYANAAGALCTSKPGAIFAISGPEEINACLKKAERLPVD